LARVAEEIRSALPGVFACSAARQPYEAGNWTTLENVRVELVHGLAAETLRALLVAGAAIITVALDA
jgi:hypothetical protein